MKEQKGITLIILTITIVIMMILAGITTYYGTQLIRQSKLQDLVTNMLLMQAKAKECLEEVSFKSANITDTTKLNEIIKENLKGQRLKDSDEIKKAAIKTGVIDESSITNEETNQKYYYYLSESDLKDMGIQELSKEDYGYFVIEYNLKDTKIEVINTKGYLGKYTLTAINKLTEE